MQRVRQLKLQTTLLCLTACIAQNLYAEDNKADQVGSLTSPQQLKTLKVEATRTDTSLIDTPASVYRIDAPQNQNNLDVNLTEVVKGIPSLQINNRENYAQDLQISMRGFGARSTDVVPLIRPLNLVL